MKSLGSTWRCSYKWIFDKRHLKTTRPVFFLFFMIMKDCALHLFLGECHPKKALWFLLKCFLYRTVTSKFICPKFCKSQSILTNYYTNHICWYAPWEGTSNLHLFSPSWQTPSEKFSISTSKGLTTETNPIVLEIEVTSW